MPLHRLAAQARRRASYRGNPAVGRSPALAGQTHSTLVKLCGWLREEKQLDLSYHTPVRYLHEHDYARRIPRRVPKPPPDRGSLGATA